MKDIRSFVIRASVKNVQEKHHNNTHEHTEKNTQKYTDATKLDSFVPVTYRQFLNRLPTPKQLDSCSLYLE